MHLVSSKTVAFSTAGLRQAYSRASTTCWISPAVWPRCMRRACHKPLLDVVGSSSLGNQHDKIVAKDDAFEFRVNFAVFRKAGTQRPEIVNRP